MSIREEQCNKVCRILDDVLANRPTERDSLIVAVRKAFEQFGNSEQLPPAQPELQEGYWIRRDCGLDVECKCSKCGYRDFVEPRDEYWFKRNYCPNCGAKMIISK